VTRAVFSPLESLDRATAALTGLAIGDALGMPTQMMSREAIADSYGTIDRFHAAAPDHPLARGMAAGRITDDTEQALLLADLLIRGNGHVDSIQFAERLVAWEDDMRRRGSLDLLGPSTKAAVEAVLHGVSVDESGRFGTTNGAAMRVTPVGIAVRSSDLEALVDRVVEASKVSHNTSVAIAGASAVAAAVSAGVEGAGTAEAIAVGIAAARLGSARGNWIAAADVASRIEWAVEFADPTDVSTSLDRIYRLIGTSLASQESVPAAFGILATFPDEPWAACCAAATLGGDADTVAAMVGAIAGASHGPGSFPPNAISTVTTVNGLDVVPVASALVALR
jgi:ADP-ribosylglycohydrolase